MKSINILAACALAAAASLPFATASQAAEAWQDRVASSAEFSAAKRHYQRRAVRHYHAPYQEPRYSAYQRGSDPSLDPDGRPYQVPAHLRGQCYFDEGYGRFSACPNR